MSPGTIADVSAGGATVQLSSKIILAKWVAVAALVHDARVGDVNTASTQGVNCSATAPAPIMVCPPVLGEVYNLANIYVFQASGGSLTVTYGV